LVFYLTLLFTTGGRLRRADKDSGADAPVTKWRNKIMAGSELESTKSGVVDRPLIRVAGDETNLPDRINLLKDFDKLPSLPQSEMRLPGLSLEVTPQMEENAAHQLVKTANLNPEQLQANADRISQMYGDDRPGLKRLVERINEMFGQDNPSRVSLSENNQLTFSNVRRGDPSGRQ
jgi:hypothetical protein